MMKVSTLKHAGSKCFFVCNSIKRVKMKHETLIAQESLTDDESNSFHSRYSANNIDSQYKRTDCCVVLN